MNYEAADDSKYTGGYSYCSNRDVAIINSTRRGCVAASTVRYENELRSVTAPYAGTRIRTGTELDAPTRVSY
eukprot:scaffold288647_cov47-Prasinocladus_malaysianus.AAC.2